MRGPQTSAIAFLAWLGFAMIGCGNGHDAGATLRGAVPAGIVRGDVHGREPDLEPVTVELHGIVVATDCPNAITVVRADGGLVLVALGRPSELLRGLPCADLHGQSLEIAGHAGHGLVLAREIAVRNG